MNRITSDLSRLLQRELAGFQREINLFPDDDSVWRTVPGITNSAGNLALHVAGSVQYFVGAVLGGTGYLRDREHEFAERSGSRQDLTAEIDAAIRVVLGVLPALPAASVDQEFPEVVGGIRIRTGLFLAQMAVHVAFHLGQVGYLRRAVTGDNRSSGPLPLQPLSQELDQ